MIKNIIYMFFLTILLVISFILIIYSKIIDQSFLIKSLNDSYYNINLLEINNNLSKTIPAHNFEYTYKDYLTIKNIKKDTLNVINKKGNNDLEKHLKSHFLSNDEDTLHIILSLTNTYNKSLFNIKIYDYFYNKININVNIKVIIFVTLFITIISFLFMLFYRNIIAFGSLIVSGVLFLLFRLCINKLLNNIFIYNKSMTYVIDNFGYNITNKLFIIGLFLLILGISLFTIHCFYKNN